MSYQVLARKWRPAKFEQMVGQSHVLMALTNALSQQRLHHAYLFTGTRGVGKTSLARLFAKGLNCETGVTANPCGECSSCIEIAQGRFVDLIEVDAASRTKVDDTRELLDNVQYRPSRGRFKVYLIDEVHMLSRSSFNALLKTLEEPPEHVKFLLATTDPHKLPVTVLSRCLQFNLKSLSQQEISKQLEYVITQEQLPFEPQALNVLAKAANGSMRDALSLTDQAIAFGSGQVMLEQVQTMLGSIDEQHVIALLKTLCDADVAPLMQMVAKVLAFGADAEEVLRSLLELLHQITLTQFAPAAAQQSLFSDQILAFAQQLAPEQVQLYYQMLLNGRKDLAFAPDPKSGLEMALLRAVAFTPEKQVKRWVTNTPAVIDLTPSQEVIDTSPKPEVLVSKQDISEPVSSIHIRDTAEVSEASVLKDGAESNKIVQQGDSDALSVDAIDTDVPTLDESESADDALTDAALIAQQQVIISQAESFGYHDPSLQHQDSAQPEPKGEDDDLNPIETQASDGTDTNDISLQASFTDALSADFDGYSYNDYDVEGDYQPSDHDDYLMFSAQSDTSQSTATLPAASAGTGEEPEPHTVVTPSEPTDSIEDPLDFLNVVLASRDSLMADIGALQQKEAATAKTAPVVNPTVKTGKSVVEPKPADVTGLSDELDVNTATSSFQELQPQKQTLVTDTVATDTVANDESPGDESTQTDAEYHRPPWVKPAPDEAFTRFTDIAQPQASVTAQALSTSDRGSSAFAASPPAITAEPLVKAAGVTASTPIQPLSPHRIEGNALDLHWYKVMTNVSVGGRVRQLGVNSVCQAQTNPLVLVLKPDQKHLSAPIAIDQLQVALTDYLQQPTQVQIQIGIVPNRETPLELRKRFHRELIAQAEQSILQDENTQWMIQRLSAQLDSDSIEYPSEQLAQIAQDIAQISAQ